MLICWIDIICYICSENASYGTTPEQKNVPRLDRSDVVPARNSISTCPGTVTIFLAVWCGYVEGLIKCCCPLFIFFTVSSLSQMAQRPSIKLYWRFDHRHHYSKLPRHNVIWHIRLIRKLAHLPNLLLIFTWHPKLRILASISDHSRRHSTLSQYLFEME